MENITDKLLETIFNRANQYALTKWNNGEPDRLELQNNGIILAVWESYRCGETEIDYETITSENLTEDLDEVAKERQIKLAEQRRIQEEENKKREVLRKQREYDERKRKYLELKKEFENA
jgi:hypothetical protein